MKDIITENIRYVEKIVLYAIKHNNNALAAKKYHTIRQNVSRWRKRYNGDIKSLLPHSRRPKSHPNAHTEEELELIKDKYSTYKREGMGQVYRKLVDAGYKRTYGSMMKQIKKMRTEPKEKPVKYPKSKFKPLKAEYPGQFVEVDIKYVPRECIGFKSYFDRYYQITAIDLYTKKRVLKLVTEKSTYETSLFMRELEEKIGFKIETVHTDNGTEFCNDEGMKKSGFEIMLEKLSIRYIRTRPYSPWQNGVVERSHRIDNEVFYWGKIFRTEEELYKSFYKYANRTNNIARKVLNFKTPNEMLEEYKEKIKIPRTN